VLTSVGEHGKTTLPVVGQYRGVVNIGTDALLGECNVLLVQLDTIRSRLILL
jgi:hypothetical protein